MLGGVRQIRGTETKEQFRQLFRFSVLQLIHDLRYQENIDFSLLKVSRERDDLTLRTREREKFPDERPNGRRPAVTTNRSGKVEDNGLMICGYFILELINFDGFTAKLGHRSARANS